MAKMYYNENINEGITYKGRKSQLSVTVHKVTHMHLT